MAKEFNMDKFANDQRASAIKASVSGNGVNAYIASVLQAYTKLSKRLHYGACIALYWATEHRDTRPLTVFHKGLLKNDADALRIWVGKLCTFDVLDEATGETSEKKFMAYTKDKGFRVLPKTEEVTKGFFTLDALMDGEAFQEVDQGKENKAIGLAELLALMARFETQIEKKAEDNGVELPESLKKMLHNVTATVANVTAHQAQAKH